MYGEWFVGYNIKKFFCAVSGKTESPRLSSWEEGAVDYYIRGFGVMNLPLVGLKDERSMIGVGDTTIGAREIVLMAGPCAVESAEQMRAAAQGVRAAGGKILRGGVYKPRTSPYSFQGLGEQGIGYLREAAAEYGLLTVTEVMDERSLEVLVDKVDILQVGSRNMQNFHLLKLLGEIRNPVILKRGLAATVEEWLAAAEYILSGGNAQVILCERGIRTFEPSTRNTLDLSAVSLVKVLSHLPVIVDPSHAAGRVDIIPALAKAAVAVGADGLLIEVHPQPEEAQSDGMQSLTPEQFSRLAAELRPIAQSVGRSMAHPPKA
ncbi:3-deoxy-7-phosphoheptulonate synthase [Desulfitobacterium hafniense]|uniref:DAHP synthetase I/KDSA domain-containing protein n=1 Tax=Desulfitobacterium hafniense (strain Y51) TaxID=138119 RepID=Q24PR7_DESHY|nr:hypothetical protein DSY4186 [Desulfitobacterium hafniense Y51]